MGVPRIEADGLVEILDRLLVVLLSEPSESAIAERNGVLRVEADSLVVVLDRLVVVPLGAPGTSFDVNGEGK